MINIFRNYGKYLSILFLFIIIGYSLFYFTYNKVKQEIIESLNARQMIHAKQASKGIETYFDDSARLLFAIAGNEHVISLDTTGINIMKNAQQFKKDEMTIMSRIDPNGHILHAEPYDRSIIGQKIVDESMKSFQKVKQTNKISVSDAFTSKRGFQSIIIHAPVITKDGFFSGTLAILLSFEAIAKKYLDDIRIGKDGYVWLIDRNGVEIYCPVSGHIGNSVFDNCREFPDIIKMAKRMVSGEQGVTTYSFNRIGGEVVNRVVKHAVFMPIRVGDNFWSIVVATPEDYVIGSLSEFKDRLLLIAALLIVLVIIILYMLIKTRFAVREIEQRKLIEKELRESERRLNASQRLAKLGDIEWNVTTGNVVCSEGIYDLTQHDKFEKIEIKKIIEKICHPYDLEGVDRWLNDCIVMGKDAFSPYEFRIIRKDGKALFVQGVGTIYRNNNIIALITIQDITNRKQAEDELKASEKRFRTFFNLPIVGFAITADDGRWIHFNEKLCDIVGYSRYELEQKTWKELTPPEDLEKEMQIFKTVLDGKVQTTNLKKRYIHKSGFLVDVFISTQAVQNPDGSIAYFASIIQDVSALRQAEEEILRERSKVKMLSDIAPFGMAHIDKNGVFTYINAKFMEIFGYNITDIPDGRSWFKKAYPDIEYRHTVTSNWIKDMMNAVQGEGVPRVFTVVCKDRTRKIIRFISSVLDSGDYLMTCEDITERTHLESQLRQAQKTEAIGTLAGGIAHDFNNILTALMGYATLMQMKMDKSDPMQSYLEQVLSASQKAVDLTQSLLAFSRKKSLILAPLDINATINETKKLLKRLLTEDIELNISLTQDETVVMADKSQIDQILLNLITNARDAMPKGGRLTIDTRIVTLDDVFIETHSFGKYGKYVLIRVSDTGVGMDEATLEKIFDPFFTTKEVGKGTGLGLATVYGIVKQHNGYIDVESMPDHGTTFHIYLPVVEIVINNERKTAITLKTGKETILIAEDNDEVRCFIRETLQQAGYKTIEAVDGKDAINKFSNVQNIDLLIIDSVMPKKNGREVYEEISRMKPHIKVIFTSGYTRDIILDKGVEDKEFDFIAKPISLNVLLQKVREVLDNPL